MNRQRSAPADDACEHADAAFDAGDFAKATRLYEYAQRLEPSDGAITLAVGLSRLMQGEPKASEAFELIAHRDDLVDAWLGLVAVRRMLRRPDLAIKDLSAALSRHGVPCDQAHLRLYDAVVAEADEVGWCTITNTNVLTVSLIEAKADFRTLEVHLDGTQVTRRLALPTVSGHSARLVLAMPGNWRASKALTVTLRNRHLIGSPLSVSHIGRVEGFVEARDGGIQGWAWYPNDREVAPRLAIFGMHQSGKPIEVTAQEPSKDVLHPRTLANPRKFALSPGELSGIRGTVRVHGLDGRNLYGSPLDPGMELRSAVAASRFASLLFPAGKRRRPSPHEFPMPSVAADITGTSPSARIDANRKIDIIIPVYAGFDETLACIDTVLSTIGQGSRCVVVEDASPDMDLVAALMKLSVDSQITLIRQEQNKGFPGTANTGMRLARGRDVVLLNSDTLVAPGWLEVLRRTVLQAPDIGTATPLSNDATILSYPKADGANAIPDLAETRRIDELARRVNAGITVDIPTGVGFCMYIRWECLDTVGLLREDLFAQGYGEENDLCIRARHLGWRHVAVPSVFVAHVGGQSFGGAKAHLIERNLAVLNRLHPGYDALIAGFRKQDPLRPARRRLDEARWHSSQPKAGSMIIITHNRGGGVLRHVKERCEAVRAQARRAILLTPAKGPEGTPECIVADGDDDRYPNLRYLLPGDLDDLLSLLRDSRATEIELHHFIGHDPIIARLPELLRIPYRVIVHDYAWFCPRINLVDTTRQYCGEPGERVCEACVADSGSAIEEPISVGSLRDRSRMILDMAAGVLVPSTDTGKRLQRQFPSTRPEVGDWGDDTALPPLRTPRHGGIVRVCVAGAIGIEKGYEILLACARHSANEGLPIEFSIVGYTSDDVRLLNTGVVKITGRYEQGEAVDLIRSQDADIGFLAAVWPETWCYALSEMWMAGLPVLAFDLGAPAERIHRTGRGWLVPRETPARSIVGSLITLAEHGRTENRHRQLTNTTATNYSPRRARFLEPQKTAKHRSR
jgi:GT2 family glycosyltransferase/glycosyltransferase involved in cell wall biosynthesis